MNKNFSRIIATFLFSLLIVFSTTAFKGCGGNGKPSLQTAPVQTQIPAADKQVVRRTVLGLNLTSAQAIPEDVDNVADASFSKLIKDARAGGYTNNLDANLYTIIVKQDCIPDSTGTPSIPMRADDYDGTRFDHHNTLGDETDPDLIASGIVHKKDGIGEITAAEQVVMTAANTPTNSYVICYGSSELMANTVRYGLEHIILFNNDFTRYKQTANHGTSGIPHPLIPEN